MNAAEITFGIEIETTLPMNVIPVGQYHVGVPAQGLPEGWKAMRDGSIRASRGRMGCEFVSPVLKGAEGLKNALQAVAAIKAMGGKVNDSCGFHVHIGFPRGNADALKRLITLTANFEKAIYASTGTKRRERSRWCGSVQRHGAVERAEFNASADRYHILNLSNLKSGRAEAVEFRAFAGTLNGTKIISHIATCLGIVERALKAKKVTQWTAPTPVASSPIARDGEGQTQLTRLFYQLGWTKGRTDVEYGVIAEQGLPSVKRMKDTLMDLARKYDAQP